MSSNQNLLYSSAVITTTFIGFVSGFLFGVYSIRGYLISPELVKERQGNFNDPVESEESDIDEDDTILDHAPNWANGADADKRQGLRVQQDESPTKKSKKSGSQALLSGGSSIPDSTLSEECKLVLVVRTDLGMTKGKIGAQCGHATLACYKTLLRASQKDPKSTAARVLQQWERRGQAKIAVQVKSEQELLELQSKARGMGVTAEVIADAGRTQIDPGSLTVLGVGPAPKSVVDKITGGLKLL